MVTGLSRMARRDRQLECLSAQKSGARLSIRFAVAVFIALGKPLQFGDRAFVLDESVGAGVHSLLEKCFSRARVLP